jgi:hypothetical protein
MSNDVSRELIVRIKRGTTESQKPVIEMYEDNPRFKYPTLRLFELHKLLDVGIDPNELEAGEERAVRFWAYYTESERLNQHGNPYLDVAYLEPTPTPGAAGAGVASDEAAVLLEGILAAVDRLANDVAMIRAYLGTGLNAREFEQRFTVGTPEVTAQSPPASADAPPAAPAKPAQGPPEEQGDGPLPLDEDQARRKFSRLTGPAVRDGLIPRELPSQLAAEVGAGAINWRDALARAMATIEEAKARQQYEEA